MKNKLNAEFISLGVPHNKKAVPLLLNVNDLLTPNTLGGSYVNETKFSYCELPPFKNHETPALQSTYKHNARILRRGRGNNNSCKGRLPSFLFPK